MKRTLTVICVGLLALGLFALSGCGGSGSETSKTPEDQGETISLDEDVATGIIGTYVEGAGGSGSIVLQEGGTFEGNAWGSEKKGKYALEKTSDDHNAAVLTFDDSGSTETWSIGISMGKVAAVTNPDGVQYNKVVK